MESNQVFNVPNDWKETLRKIIITAINGSMTQRLKAYRDVGYSYECYAPSSLYKYYPPKNYCLDSIKGNQMWYSAPSKFNDAFDTMFSYDKDSIVKSIVQQLLGEKGLRIGSPMWKKVQQAATQAFKDFEKTLSMIRETTGVTCLSETDDSMLMWAHYAGNHQGVCVEYDLMRFNKELEFTPIPIIYSAERPQLLSININDAEESILPFFLNCLTTKSPEWNYENEWRIIRDKKACGDAWDHEKSGALLPSLKPLSIKLGCDAHGEFAENIYAYCKEKQVNLYRMKRDEKEYRLNKVPVLLYSE